MSRESSIINENTIKSVIAAFAMELYSSYLLFDQEDSNYTYASFLND